jgi:hypothetical protein
MSSLTFSPEDMTRALEVANSASVPPATGAELERLAFVIGAERRSHAPETVTTRELLFAHDLLYMGAVRGGATGLREALASALLARGHVPGPHEYEGRWWLWWPSRGSGVCQSCRRDRYLRRYSNVWGKPYRYLCQRCRDQEIAEETEELDRATGVTVLPGESVDSLLRRRMSALIDQGIARRNAADQPENPSLRKFKSRGLINLLPLYPTGVSGSDESHDHGEFSADIAEKYPRS